MATQCPQPQRRRLQDGPLAELSIVNRVSGESTVIYETAELIEAPNWTPDRVVIDKETRNAPLISMRQLTRIFPC